jgi:hypothetical protein
MKEKPSELRRGRIRFHNGDATIYFTIGLDKPNPFPRILAQSEIRKGTSNIGIKGMIPSVLDSVKRPVEIGNAAKVAGLQTVPDVNTPDSIGRGISVHRSLLSPGTAKAANSPGSWYAAVLPRILVHPDVIQCSYLRLFLSKSSN